MVIGAGTSRPAWTAGGLRQARRSSARLIHLYPWFDSALLSRAGVRGLDDFQVGARDAGPGAAGVELEIALPVLDRLAVAAIPGERAREIEMRVGVVRRKLEGPAIIRDRLLDRTAVFVQGAEVVGGLAALGVLIEGRQVRFARLVVATHAMQQEAEVVPCRGVCRIDRDHAAVGVDRVLPLRRVAVPLAGALEPGLGLIGGRSERSHQPRAQRGGRGLLETTRVEGQDHLPRTRIEPYAVGLGDEPVALEDQAHLGERLLEIGVLTTQGRERGPDLAHRRTRVEKRAGRAERQQIAERVAGVAAKELEAPELSGAPGRERQDPGQLPDAVDALGLGRAHRILSASDGNDGWP